MAWKGALRSFEAGLRRSERNARSRQRELEKRSRELEKMEELERAAYEVQVYENYLDVLLSVHKDCGNSWNWESVQTSEPPIYPSRSSIHESAAQTDMDKFKPGTIDRLLKRVDSKREQLAKAVDEAKRADEELYQEALKNYEQELVEHQEMIKLAARILADEPEAHLEAIKQIDPFSEIVQLGSSITFQLKGNLIEAVLYVNSEEVIPSESRTLLKSGKLSVKKMSKSKFYELYQDYVCGAVLRIARELFALLPVEMILVTAIGNLLNTQTGYIEEQPILSVAIPRKTLENLNFDLLDPSDCMANFVHRMNFKKTSGFAKVESFSPEEIKLN